MTPDQQKSTIRNHVLSKLKELSQDRREDSSQAIGQMLLSCDALGSAETILAFAPLATEPMIDPVIDRWRSEGRTILLPRTLDEPGMMELAPLECLMCDLPVGAFGIRTPSGPSHSGDVIDAILVPGIAFDRQGRRLGHGGGYYDRLLAEVRSSVVLGVGFECQLQYGIPEDAHDQRVHGVVTEQGIVGFNDPRPGRADDSSR